MYYDINEVKQCSGYCGCSYPETEDFFYKMGKGFSSKCKKCYIDDVKCNQHGITLEELHSKDAVTNCEICEAKLTRGSSSNGRTMDHNHVTGEMRGVLCNNCNRGIGLLQDNPWIIKRSLEYLKKYGSYVDSDNFD